MYRRVFAFDFDGTLALKGRVEGAMLDVLTALREAEFVMFLVTGRRYQSMHLGPLSDLLTGIVWENGAVLQTCATPDVYLPFGRVDPHLVDELRARKVPLEHGAAIVATWAPHEEAVWRAIAESGTDATLAHNKGAIMILPPGASKGSGLARLLDVCGYSAHNLVAFGDAENDLPLFELAETSVAVADAVATLHASADLVAERPGPEGVADVLHTYWLRDRAPRPPARRPALFHVGDDTAGTEVFLSGPALAGGCLGVFGDSGTGKSWFTGLLAEDMIVAGYQVLVVDPEGDHRALRTLPRAAALSGDARSLPTPEVMATLLDAAGVSVILDLSGYPYAERPAYIAELLRALGPLLRRKFRPHWLVLEEAQQFTSPDDAELGVLLEPFLTRGGTAFVSYRPDRLPRTILDALSQVVLARLTHHEPLSTIARLVPSISESDVAKMPRGHVWLAGKRLVQLRPAVRRISHVRHLYKYLDAPLPPPKRFYFRTPSADTGMNAANLFELGEVLSRVPAESIEYHDRRGDFAAWARTTLCDESLAAYFDKLSRRALDSEMLRSAMLNRVHDHYAEIAAR